MSKQWEYSQSRDLSGNGRWGRHGRTIAAIIPRRESSAAT